MSPPRSKAWICFSKINNVSSKCKLCSQEVKYSGNTTNLQKHLLKHPNVRKTAEELRRILQSNQTTLSSSVPQSSEYFIIDQYSTASVMYRHTNKKGGCR